MSALPTDAARRLDERLLPALAARLRALADRWQVLVDRLPLPERAEPEEAPELEPRAPLPVRLRALDDRYARRGLLGLLAEVPQLAAVLVTLLLAVSAFTIAARQSGSSSGTTSGGQPGRVEGGGVPTLAFVGIQPGAAVGPYIAAAKHRLETLAITPDASVIGLMVFDHYVTPQQAAALASPTRPTRAYYAPGGKGVKPGETAFASVVNLAVDLPAQLKAAAVQLMVRVKQNETFARTIAGSTAEERAQKAELTRDAQRWRAEAAALSATCACVFAVVVRGPARVLVDLASRPGVRFIDPAPAGAQTGLLEFQPLRPEVDSVQPTVGPGAP